MSKTALLFAGQGAQVVGMGKDLAETYASARACSSGPTPRSATIWRPSVLTGRSRANQNRKRATGHFPGRWVAFQLLKERAPALSFQAAAGLSLGEFTALTAAGAMSFEEGLRVVRQRGRFMQQACETNRGGMAAVIGLDEAPTREVCAQAGVVLANLNCPGQLVISGAADRMVQACELAKAKGARRALPLPVAGAYHSPLMAGAQPKLQAELARVTLNPPAVAVVSNVTARPHETPESIRARLVEQVTASVRWEESMRWLLSQGFTRFIELGPGTALSGFMKRIDKTGQTLNVADVGSLGNAVKILEA